MYIPVISPTHCLYQSIFLFSPSLSRPLPLSLPTSLRSLPGSALELRYSHGGGSLPTGSTAHLDHYGNANTVAVVRRTHRGRWSTAREDTSKVRDHMITFDVSNIANDIVTLTYT